MPAAVGSHKAGLCQARFSIQVVSKPGQFFLRSYSNMLPFLAVYRANALIQAFRISYLNYYNVLSLGPDKCGMAISDSFRMQLQKSDT